MDESPDQEARRSPSDMLTTLALALLLQSPKIDYAQAWSTIRNSIETRYYARKSQGPRMKLLLDKYEPLANGAKDEAGFEKEVNAMIADFGDSHFGFYTKRDQSFFMMDSLVKRPGQEFASVGAWFRPVEDGYAIQMLLNGGAAESAGLRKGDIVTQVDGHPFTPVDSLTPLAGKRAKLTYLRDSKPGMAEVEVTKTNGHDFFVDATRASIKTIDYQGKRYGYIHLWTMADDDEKNALAGAVLGRLKDTDGFILDIRDGFGGRPEGFGDPFFRPGVTLSWEMPNFTQKELFGYQKPLVVIINQGSRSAKEVFAYIMKVSHRAILVGERTGGNVLGTFPSAVGDWAYLEIPLVDVKANGERLEKVGVAPDDPVAPEFDAGGKDRYLDESLKVLATASSKGGGRP